MKKMIYKLALIVSLGMMPMFAVSQVAMASPFASSSSQSAACQGITVDGSNPCTGNSGSTVGNIINTVINIMSIILGAVAVIMIIVAGFKFVTSGGDAQRVASARNTLIYAIVGIVVVAIAQILVHFVLTKL